MRSPSRRVMIVSLVLLIGVVGSSIAGSFWLRVWVPTKGKSWLEKELRRQLPIDVHIGSMTYSPWDGFLLEDVTATDRNDPSTRWFHAPQLRVRTRLLTLLVRRQVVFHLEGPLTVPCETTLVASGTLELRNKALETDLLASEIALNRITPPLAQYLPPALKAGTIQLKLRVKWRPGVEPVIAGRMVGTRLVWERDAIRFMGQVRLDGTVMPPADGANQQRWWADLSATIAQGRLEGLPVLGSASEISGTLRFSNDTLAIDTLRGTTLGSPWQLEGVIRHPAEPDLDLLVRARVDTALVAAKLVTDAQPWQPTGALEVVMVCRGPLAQWPNLDIMAHAVVHDASLTIPARAERIKSPTPGRGILFNSNELRSTHPLPPPGKPGAPPATAVSLGRSRALEEMLRSNISVDHLTGTLEYDHLAKHLTIGSLAGRIHGAPVTLRGAVALENPAAVDLTADTAGEVPLALLSELLPPESPVRAPAGFGSIHVDLHGPLTQLTWQGAATVRDATLTVRGVSQPLEEVRGTVHFTDQQLSTQRLTFVVDHQPVLLTLTITNLSDSPHLDGRAHVAEGSITFSGTLYPDQLALEVGECSIGSSHLGVHGSISRLPHQASQLAATGSLSFADLGRLPWFPAKPPAAWQLDGDVNLRVQLNGSFEDWRAVSVSGVVQAETMSVRGIPVRALSAEFERGQQRRVIRVTNAKVADGRVTGEFILEEEETEAPRSLLELDATMVDLAQLAPAIPAWHQRRIEGTVSGHASFMRFGTDRTRLQGRGWLHAKGARLGELPLLDRFFRGVFGALADRLGLSTLRTTQLTELGGQWRVFNARVLTEDLQLSGVSGGEPVTISVQGSVGLDKTLDLVIEPDLSEQLILQAPEISALSRTVLNVVGGVERLRRLVGRHHVGGTIDKPEYTFEVSLNQLLNQLFPSGIDRLLDSVR